MVEKADAGKPLREILLKIAALTKQGQGREALGLFERLLSQLPDMADLWFQAGELAESLGEDERALTLFRGGLSRDPTNEDILLKVAICLRREGKLEEAVARYKAALTLRPESPAFLNGYGVVLLDMKRPDEAGVAFAKALTIDPENPEPHNNLGLVQNFKGLFGDGIPYFKKALALDPSYGNAMLNLATSLAKTGQMEEALQLCRKAVDLVPQDSGRWLQLGTVLKLKGRLAEATEALEKALALGGRETAVCYVLGNTLHGRGQTEKARRVLKKGEGASLLREALMAPIIPQSEAEIATLRKDIPKRLDDLEKSGFQLEAPTQEIRFTNFLLAYHDANDRALQERIAKFYRKVCPMLNWEAPHCQRPRDKPLQGRIKIGIASAFLHGHTIGKLYGGLIEDLPRDRFEVTLIRAGGQEDSMARHFDDTADHVIRLSNSYVLARQAIAECEFDLLFYPDIGMDALTYFLSFARLAPVQMTSLGHPMTTGLKTMDYFLTAKTNEFGDMSDHYTETPLMLERGPVFMRRPEVPKKPMLRSVLGLPEERRLYVCPQTLFKFHPAFDAVLGRLLSEDRDGLLVLIGDHVGGDWQEILEARFAETFPESVDRVIFTRRLSGDEYFGLLMMADALLDIPQFSGGNSTLEAFACAAPIVTRPSAFMKGRLTDGYYREMAMDDLVAKNDEEYVALALKLASDKDFHREMSKKIKDRVDRLFDRRDVVEQTALLMERAVIASMKGEKIA